MAATSSSLGSPSPAGDPNSLTLARVARLWWPLAASWFLMGLEGPGISAAAARLAHPEVSLAAYGGVVFPLALMIEAPIIMLLAASTALSKDWTSYRKLLRFTHVSSLCLTLLHALIVFSPLYYVVVRELMHAPEEVVQPARLGLMILLPWTWAIAFRRFNQGVLIRSGRSVSIGTGSLVRLLAEATVLVAGYLIGSVAGVVVASSAVAVGVLSEAGFIRLRVNPLLKTLKEGGASRSELTLRSFLGFYIPLSLMSLIGLLAQPLAAAGLGRMPAALVSLAAWPVVGGFAFIIRSPGVAYNEVVVALLEQPGSSHRLRRFTLVLSAASTAFLLVFLAPPVQHLVFDRLIGLSADLSHLVGMGLWLTLPQPAASVLQSWFQGVIMHSRRTRSITESVVLYLAVTGAILSAGVVWGGTTGIYVGVVATTLGEVLRTVWLGWRSRAAREEIARRDAQLDGVRTVARPGGSVERDVRQQVIPDSDR